MKHNKYRAWDNVENKMYYAGEEELILFMLDSSGIMAEKIIPDNSIEGFHVEKLEHLQYMQSTGLKDVNGVEIYEGDVVTGVENSHWHDGYDVQRGIVEYKTWLTAFYVDASKYKTLTGGAVLSDVENLKSIGNIYENPELLGDDK